LPITEDGVLLTHSASKSGNDKRLDADIKLALARKIPASELEISEGLFIFRNETLHVPLDIIDEKRNKAFLDALAALFIEYRQSGLPFDLYLSEQLAGLDDIEERDAIIENAWYEKSEWKTGIAFDIKKRSYFGHINAIKCEAFQSVNERLTKIMNDWRAPVDSFIKAAQKTGKKS
jgi:hypothetical protein